MNISIIGKGNVGSTLGQKWNAAGHQVIYGVRTPSADNEKSIQEATSAAQIILLAVPAQAITKEFFQNLPLENKILIDCTNPIKQDFSDLDPISEGSMSARIAKYAPQSSIVKAFNSVGSDVMANPTFNNTPATMLIASDDQKAKIIVTQLAVDAGFSPLDAGGLNMARHLESQAWIWITQAINNHSRSHAFIFTER